MKGPSISVAFIVEKQSPQEKFSILTKVSTPFYELVYVDKTFKGEKRGPDIIANQVALFENMPIGIYGVGEFGEIDVTYTSAIKVLKKAGKDPWPTPPPPPPPLPWDQLRKFEPWKYLVALPPEFLSTGGGRVDGQQVSLSGLKTKLVP